LPGRPPQTPEQILERFQQLLKTQEFKGLGPTGKGQLSISGGLAVYPYDARDVNELIDEADRRLMFGAKRSGKNSIYLVGSDSSQLPPDEAKP
jgi:GGDEF domain-containing protein